MMMTPSLTNPPCSLVLPPRGVFAVLPALALLAVNAFGQGAPAAGISTPPRPSLGQTKALPVATITTASKREEKATEAPGTVQVVDQHDIRARGYADLKDVLRDLPGMETIEFYHSELGTLVPVRGIVGNNKIVFLVNGMRVNPPGGEEMPLRGDFSVRHAEQIEVVYGPASTLYGQDAVSAVINVKTKQPATEKLELEAGALGGLHAERGAWGSFGKVFDAAGNVRLSGYIDYHDSELTRLDREYPDYWREFKAVAEPRGRGTVPERQDFGLNAMVRLEAGAFSLQAWHRESERSSSEGILSAFGFLEEAKLRDRSTVVEAGHTLQLSDQVSLASAVTYNRFEIDPDSRFVFPASPTSWVFNDYKYAIGVSVGIEETLRVDFDRRGSLLAGLVATGLDIIPKATVPGKAHPAGWLKPDGGIVAQAGSFQFSDADDGTFEQAVPRATKTVFQRYGGYVEAGWQISPGLKAVAGVRVDRDTRIDDRSVSPRAALIYQVTEALTAKYLYREAYTAPAPYFSSVTSQNAAVLVTVSPDLKPETEQTHEFNLTFARASLNLGVSAYYGTQSGLIKSPIRGAQGGTIDEEIFIPANPSRRRLVAAANGGDSSNTGFDVYGRAAFGRVRPWFSYSYVNFREEENGVSIGLQAISRHQGRAGLTWAVTSRLCVTPSLVIRSTPEHVDASVLPDEARNPWEANLHLLYGLRKGVEIFANLRNLTDNHNALGGSRAATAAGLPRVIPQETFSGVLGVRVAF